MNNKETLNKIIEAIKTPKKCLVLAHQNPDGDTLGSMLAIGAILSNLGHEVDRVISDPVPVIYRFLLDADKVMLPDDERLMRNYDLAFSLDCGSVKRLGKAGEFFTNAKETINIDHHISNERFAKYNLIEAEATSTGQVLHGVAKAINAKITPDIASLLYVTLLTDTGCYSNSNTNALAMTWASELIALGADHLSIYRKAFLEKPFKSIKIFGTGLHHMEFIYRNEILFTYVDKNDMNRLGATSEDTEDIIDHMMTTQGAKIGIFLRETDDETKVSLRSNTDFDVSKIASELGGGGHKRAAGINIKKALSEVKEIIVNKVLEEYKTCSV